MKKEKKETGTFLQAQFNFSLYYYYYPFFVMTHPSYSMLYRTQHHQSFLPKPPHSSPSLSSHLLLLLLLQEMECVQQGTPLMDDFSATTDDLFVDELLDFSTAFSDTEQQFELPEENKQNHDDNNTTVFEEKIPQLNVLSPKDDFGSLPVTELNVPAEGLESLEWLSHFVQDSFPDYSLTGKLPPPKPVPNRVEPVQDRSNLSNTVTKARTKRARTGVRVWPVLSDSSTSSSSSTSSTTTSFPSPVFWPVMSVKEESFFAKPQKKKAGLGVTVQARRCGHCGVTKTPQWRAGPLGAKTLCNACGVRFKSGRLLPEYRPACSPTFSSDLHSNNHRKVMEMRHKKETETGPVQSF